MRGEHQIDCPFCNEPTLTAVQTMHNVNASGWGRSKKLLQRRDIREILLAGKCMNCGKTEEEIRKKYKESGITFA